MATVFTDSGTTTSTTIPFTSPVVLTPVGAAGLTPGGVQSSFTSTTSPVGKAYNYTLVVQIPIPFFGIAIDGNLVGNFILPALTKIGVPQAITYLVSNAEALFNSIVADAMKLVKAIPEASVTILVKIGSIVVLNIVLVAVKEPVIVPVPSFSLDLPNFAVDADFTLSIPFPAPEPVLIEVPIPVPIVAFPPSLVTVTGGNVSVVATGSAQPEPVPVANPIYLPTL